MEGVGAILRRLRHDRGLRDLVLYVALGAPLTAAGNWVGERALDPQAAAFFTSALTALFAGGFIFMLFRGALRRGEDRIAELRADGERFRHLSALSADWFWETDSRHRVTWLAGGASAEALFGGQRVFGKCIWDVEWVNADPVALTAHGERLAQRLPFFDLELGSRGKRKATHLVSGEPRFDAVGRFLGYRGVGRDVTEQRGAEQALAQAKRRLEQAVAGGGLAEWDYDLDADRIYLGEGWARLMGRTPEAEYGTAAYLYGMVHPDDQERARRSLVEALKDINPDYAVEYRIRMTSGEWRWQRVVGRVTERHPDGRARRMAGVVTDIHDRQRAEEALREAEERYRRLVELTPAGIMLHSNGVIEYVNAAMVRLLRAGSAQQVLGRRVEELVHPDERERNRERLDYLYAGPGRTPVDTRRVVCLDGSEALFEVSGVSYLEHGRLVVQSVVRDVTEERQTRVRLAEREQRFRDVVEASGEFVWETDAEWRYTYLSERAEAVLGFPRSEMLWRRPQGFLPLGEDRRVAERFERIAADGAPFRDFQHRALTRAGGAIWLQMSGVPVRDGQGRVQGFRGTAADVSARKAAEERIEYLATRDALTGLPNRLLLTDLANRAILAAARGRGQLALLAFNLDRFKLVNDSLGHKVGDGLLRAVAERLQNALRREDTLARLGGDDFVLLWDGLKSSDDAAVTAQRVLGILARPFTVEGHSLSIGASIGIAVYPDDGRDFADLLRNADSALHHAKEQGGGAFRFFSPALMARASERLKLENDLRGALARGELVLHWHPTVRGRGAKVVGAEALVRWKHPERGLLLPEDFIPLAEDCGLIRPVGEWTLDRALSQIGAWKSRLPAGLRFAVNVSAPELAQGGAYVERLAASLAANGVEGKSLELEVTERVLMHDFAAHSDTLRRIGELGVRFAIDDFGTGYSSLAYLRLLPIDKLKIDRSFLRELSSQPADEAIVRTIADMARNLGLAIAAEGVETEAQLARLLELGCEEWQGHYCSPPLEAPDFEQLFQSGAGSRFKRAKDSR